MKELLITQWRPGVDMRSISARTDKLRPLLKRWRLKPGQAALVTNGNYSRVRLVFRTDDDQAGVVWYEADKTQLVLSELFKAAVTHIMNGWPHAASMTVPSFVINHGGRRLRAVA